MNQEDIFHFFLFFFIILKSLDLTSKDSFWDSEHMFFDFVFPINVNSLSFQGKDETGGGGVDAEGVVLSTKSPSAYVYMYIRDDEKRRKIVFFFFSFYSSYIFFNGSNPTLTGAADRALASFKSFGQSTGGMGKKPVSVVNVYRLT